MKRVIFLSATLSILLYTASGIAGGPLSVNSSGSPAVWSNSGQIPYNPDRGTLGALGQTQAAQLVADSFAKWSGVSTASVGFANKGLLPVDINKSNYTNYLSKEGDGINPIVFDTDGSIIEQVFGPGQSESVLGYAAAIVINGKIAEGESVLNGRFVGSTQEGEIFKATLVHEFGHYIGLDHSQINSFAMQNGSTTDDIYLPTMFPTATDDDLPLINLNPDDIAWVSELYPSGGSTLGAIEGYIRTSGGSNFDGANVVARRASDPLYAAISCVSSYKDPVAKGFYRIPKIAAGKYTVGVDQILGYFIGGSSVGPFTKTEPVELSGPPEYFNGADESSSASSDRPDDSESIRVGSGAKVTGINITLNTGWPTAANVAEKEPNSTMETAQILSGSRRVSGTAASSDSGDISLTDPDDDIEDLYFLNLTNAANIEFKLDPADNSVDLDLAGFFPSLVIFTDKTRNFPDTNSGNEEFGPVEIGSDGAYIGVTYWDGQGAGSVGYTLTVNVSRFPIGIENLSPGALEAGQSNQKIVVTGSGFSSGSSASFSNPGIAVNSVKYVNPNQLDLTVSLASNASTGYANLIITSSQNQKGTLTTALRVMDKTVKPTAATQWELY